MHEWGRTGEYLLVNGRAGIRNEDNSESEKSQDRRITWLCSRDIALTLERPQLGILRARAR